MNQTFDLTRFGTLLKSDCRLNKSSYLKLGLGIIAAFVFFAVLISFFAHNTISEISSEDYDAIQSINGFPTPEFLVKEQVTKFSGFYAMASVFVASFALTILGSLTFTSLSDKKSRISTLMIPASMTEKYWLRVLIYLFGGTVVIAIGWLIGFLIAHLVFGATTFIDSVFGEVSTEDVPVMRSVIAAFVLWAFVGQAIYVLGSALWPKLSWVKTWLVLTGLQWLFGMLMIAVAFSGYDFVFKVGMWMKNLDFLTVWICVSSVLIIGLYAAAWFRFRSTQIVQLFMRK